MTLAASLCGKLPTSPMMAKANLLVLRLSSSGVMGERMSNSAWDSEPSSQSAILNPKSQINCQGM